MQATSNAQYESTIRDTVPDLEPVREGVWALATPVPFSTVSYTLTYLVRDSARGVHVIDPGWDSDDNWGALAFSLHRIGRSMSDVASVIVSHLHPDHTGMAERLRKASRAPIVMHRAEQEAIDRFANCSLPSPDIDSWGVPLDRRKELRDVTAAADRVPILTADVLVEHGHQLDVPGRGMSVIHTPGHTSGSISIRQADEALLYTSDTLLPAVFPGLGLGAPSASNPISDYLDSLAALAAFDDHEVCPGHGYRFTGLAGRVERTAAHHNRRRAEVARALSVDPAASVWHIASHLTWTIGWPNLHGFYLHSALAQTAMHIDLVGRAAA